MFHISKIYLEMLEIHEIHTKIYGCTLFLFLHADQFEL